MPPPIGPDTGNWQLATGNCRVYSIDGIIPVIAPSAFVHPTAVLIGDVIIGAGCYVGPCASLRGDFGRLILEPGSNLQDTCVMHGFPGEDTIIAADGHVGHGAVLHGCRIGRNAMVGMNAVIMDGAEIGDEAIVAAASFIKAKFVVPARHLAQGVPAKVVRELTEQEIAWKTEGTRVYQDLTRRSLASHRAVEPLRAVEPNRRRIPVVNFEPLYKAAWRRHEQSGRPLSTIEARSPSDHRERPKQKLAVPDKLRQDS